MNTLLFGGTASQADELYRRLLSARRNNETEVFQIIESCAEVVYQHNQTLNISPEHARITHDVLNQYRPVEGKIEFSRGTEVTLSDETMMVFDSILGDLKRLSTSAGRPGRVGQFSIPQIKFIVAMERLFTEDGRLAADLFQRVYRFTFGKNIHLPDVRATIDRLAHGIIIRRE